MLMKTIVRLYDHWYYGRPYAKFYKISYLCDCLPMQDINVSLKSRNMLNELFVCTQEIQKKLGELNRRFVDLCANCEGKCCRHKSTDWYFTVIDYWLRKDGSYHIDKYSKLEKRYWYQFISPKLIDFFRNSAIQNNNHLDYLEGKCEYIKEDGFNLAPQERPIKCLLHYCKILKDSMDYDFKKSHAKLVNELYNNSYGVFKILRKESGYSFLYGWIFLLLTK